MLRGTGIGSCWILGAISRAWPVLLDSVPAKTCWWAATNLDLDRIFGFPKSVARRHLSLVNANGQVVVKPKDKESKTKIAAVDVRQEADQLIKRRIAALQKLRQLYGGPIALLTPDEALETLDRLIAILSEEAYRPKNPKGSPGGLLTLPAKPTPIIVGDIHAQIDNLISVCHPMRAA